MDNIDIKDFHGVSAVSELDNILLVQSTGANGKITVALFKAAIRDEVTPSINNNTWWIGTVDTGVVAAGKTPQFRAGEYGIEWKYTSDETWQLLVNYDSISLKFSDLTTEEKNSLKLKFTDLTEDDISLLQQPARDMIAELELTNTKAGDAEDLRMAAEEQRQTDTDEAVGRALAAALVAEGAAENVQDGKTPVFEVGTVSKGENPSASITEDGTDPSGNPKYKINLTLPEGYKGDAGKTPILEFGSITTGEPGTEASATFVQNGTDLSGNPKYLLSLTIPRGNKGNRGDDGKTPVIGAITAESVSSSTTPTFSLTDSGNKDGDGNPIYTGTIKIPAGQDGKDPVFVSGTTTTLDPDEQAVAEVVADGLTLEGKPRFKINLSIPQGQKGVAGDGSGNVTVLNHATGQSAKIYVLKPSANGSLSYDIQEIDISNFITNSVNNLLNYYLKNETYSKTEVDGIVDGIDLSGFITNSANDLLNYYLKSETYTRDEVQSLINSIQSLQITQVDVLPTTGESNKIYLVPKAGGTGTNVKDEYIWIGAWEHIGTTEINLVWDNISDKPTWIGASKPSYTYSEIGGTKPPTNAQKNSDITKAEIEAKLTGAITSHTHNYLSESPQDGKIYGRKDGSWAEVGSSGSGEVYDWTWLMGISSQGGTCTQQQYDELEAAMQTGKIFPQVATLRTLPMPEDAGYAIVLSMISIIGSDVYFYTWGIYPDLSVVFFTYGFDEIVQQSINRTVEPYTGTGSSTRTVNLSSSNFPILSGCTTINVNLSDESVNDGKEYVFQFTCGATPVTLNMPAYIKWINEPYIEANKTYQVSVVNRIAVIGGAL